MTAGMQRAIRMRKDGMIAGKKNPRKVALAGKNNQTNIRSVFNIALF